MATIAPQVAFSVDPVVRQVQQLLLAHRARIYQRARQKHLQYLGPRASSRRTLRLHRQQVLQVIQEVATRLTQPQPEVKIFTELGEAIALISLKKGMSLEEAVDGMIFLKHAFWDELQAGQLLPLFTAAQFSHVYTQLETAIDVMVSKLSFVFHANYQKVAQIARQRATELQTITNNLPDAITRHDQHFRYVYVNPQVEKELGIPAKELLGKTYWQVFGPQEICAFFDTQLQRAFQQQEPFTIEYSSRLGGVDKFYQSRVVPELDEQGRVATVLIISRDLTQRKASEEVVTEAARKERERLISLFMQAPAFICILKGANHIFEMANSEYHRLIGRKDLIGRSVAEVLPEVRDQGFLELLNRVYYQGEVIHGKETKILFRHHPESPLSERYVNFVYQPIRDDDGQINGIFVHGVDVTDQVESRRRLKEREAYYRRYTEAMPQMAFIADAAGNIIYYNQRWYDYIGRDRRTTGWGWQTEQVHHPADLDRTVRRWQSSLRSGRPYEIEYRLRRADGEYRWHLGRAIPFKDPDGQIIYWLGTNTDIHQQKLTEEALKQSEERFKAAFAHAGVGVAVTDAAGSYVFVNKAYQKLTGYTQAELKQMQFQQIIFLDDAAENQRQMERMLAGKVPGFIIENRYQRKDGQPLWVRKSVSVVRDRQKQVQNIIAITEDITERKQYEQDLGQSLRQQQQTLSLLQSLLKNAPVGFAFFDRRHQYIQINDHLAELNGIPAAAHLGHTLEELLPLNAKVVGPLIDQVFRTGQAILNREIVGETPKQPGKTRYWLTGYYPVMSQKGRKVEYVGAAVIEITDRKKMEQALRISETKFKGLFDSNIIGINLSKISGQIVDANQAFLKMIGRSRSELRAGHLSWDRITPKDYRKVEERAIRQLRRDHFSALYEKEYIRPDGSHLPVLVGRVLYDIQKGDVITFALDISERKRLDQRKDEFIGIASHELKTPLTSIKGYTQILERLISQYHNQQADSYITKLNLYIDRLNSLISDLLDVSKIQAGKLQLESAVFDLHQLITESVESIQPTVDSHRIRIQRNTHAQLCGDQQRLEQVLVNLLSNAVKYSPAAHQVVVRAWRRQQEVVISVRDFGVGIPLNQQSKLFQRFYRVEATAQQFSGLGIGLYISAQIVERHHGRIWVESREGAGATFYVALPIYEDTTS